MYIYVCIYTYIYIPVNSKFRLSHLLGRDSRGQETFLAPSLYNQTCNYYTDCSDHHPPLATLRSKRLNHSKMKW